MGKVIYMWDIRTNGLVVALYIAYIISFYIYVIYALVQFSAPRFEYIESGITLGIKKKTNHAEIGLLLSSRSKKKILKSNQIRNVKRKVILKPRKAHYI